MTPEKVKVRLEPLSVEVRVPHGAELIGSDDASGTAVKFGHGLFGSRV
jgi:hypothetical protein